MLFDGCELKKGDLVFDTEIGNGVIEELINGSIVVRFGTKWVRYDLHGKTPAFNSRTLYKRDD
jgi:hypothetical protein